MKSLMDGQKGDFSKPGLTPNIPDWAGEVAAKNAVGIILETAHPAKFGEVVQAAGGKEPPVPERLAEVLRLPDRAIPMENDYAAFKDWLKANLK